MERLTNEQISLNMKAMRVKADLTQQEVADKLGLTRETIIKWERDAGRVNISTFAILADLYNCKISDFFVA